MPPLLEGKTSVITGCQRGIGKATLELFAKNGSNVWACVRKADDEFYSYLNNLARETGVNISPLAFDLADFSAVKAAANQIIATKQPIDVLVNNAGMIFTALFQMTSMDRMKELFEINFFSQILFTQYLAKVMTRQKSGSIINISSSAAIEGNEGRLAYASAKAAIITSTKVMARELGVNGIRVNAIAPGLTQTDMMTNSTPEVALNETLARTCLKRVGRPEEIASSCLFLASSLSSYMSGQVLRVDGGM